MPSWCTHTPLAAAVSTHCLVERCGASKPGIAVRARVLSECKSPPQPLCSSKEDSEWVANEVTRRTQLNGEHIGAIVEASTSNGDASVVHLKQGCRESVGKGAGAHRCH